MTTRHVPGRRARGADWARLAGGLALPVLVLGALGARMGIVPAEAILPTLFLGFSLAMIALALGIHALTDIWSSGAGGARAAIAGIVYASPVVAILGLISLAAIAYPRLTDVSTDVENPPAFASSMAKGNFDAMSAALQREAYPNLAPRTYGMSLGEVYVAARELFEARGWMIRRSVEPVLAPPPPAPAPAAPALDEELVEALAQKDVMTQSRSEVAGTASTMRESSPPEAAALQQSDLAILEATAETPIFRFRDDVVLRIERTPEGTRVDMRSASRTGEHDLGQNARRIRSFLADLDAALQPETPGGVTTAGR